MHRTLQDRNTLLLLPVGAMVMLALLTSCAPEFDGDFYYTGDFTTTTVVLKSGESFRELGDFIDLDVFIACVGEGFYFVGEPASSSVTSRFRLEFNDEPVDNNFDARASAELRERVSGCLSGQSAVRLQEMDGNIGANITWPIEVVRSK